MSSPREPEYQASVFINSYRNRIPDPHHSLNEHCWVTVDLPEEMSCNSHTDNEVMCFVYQMINYGRVTMDAEPQHSRGMRCISLPIRLEKPYPQDESFILIQAKRLAAWWINQIRANRVTLDQRMVFDTPRPCRESGDSLFEVSKSWGKPCYAGWS